MEWLRGILQDPTVLIIATCTIVSIFIIAARKAHLNYVAKMKKINDTFNNK